MVPLPELATVAAQASRAVPAELASASTHFDARAGAVCRDLAARYLDRPGAWVAPQAVYFLSVVAGIVAEDRTEKSPVEPATASPYRHDPMFRMLDRCAPALPAFVEGRIPGVDVVFPKGDRHLWAELHGHSLHMGPYGRVAGATVHALLPVTGQILEIGAGSGSATAALLERSGGRVPVRYVVTDISPTLLRDANTRFTAAGLEYATHDFTQPPPTSERFDVVFGANALHCAADVRAGLRYALNLLVPGGYLVLTEGMRPASGRVWRPELIFALLPGWWQVETDPEVRPDVGFLSGGGWKALLREAGGASVAVLPIGATSANAIGYLIVARKAGT